MRILIVSAVFPPEPVVSAHTSADVAAGLASHGHAVRVMAPFPNRPAGKLYPGFKRCCSQTEDHPLGYRLTRLFSLFSPRSTLFSRLLENLSFGLSAARVALVLARPDLIYANTWPVLATSMLSLVAWLRRVPLVISVQDMYPESLAAQGHLKENSALAKLLRWLDGSIARRATAVLVISEKFRELYLQRGVMAGRIHVVPNWLAPDAIDCEADQAGLRARLGIPAGVFLMAYAGNIGVAADVEGLLLAMGPLLDEERAVLLIAGEGSHLEACRRLVERERLPGVVFHSPWPVEDTSSVLRAADLLLLPTRGEQSLASVPSKLITYMLAGRPVLALVDPDSEVAAIIQETGCGWVAPQQRMGDLADLARKIMRLPAEELQWRGSAGRDYALGRFTTAARLPGLIDLIENLVPQGGRG